MPRQSGANCAPDCPHRKEVGDYERVPGEINYSFRTLSNDEQHELMYLADLVARSDLCSTLFPYFIESYQNNTGNEPSGAVRHIAKRIGIVHDKGLHFRPAIVALVLREFVRLNS